MEFGIQFTQQLPRPWRIDSEKDLFENSLNQIELADELGFDYAWVVEQHFLEEYSHSSAPEIFLAAASQRTQSIRLGHGVVLMPPGYNEPVRVAERIATLDLISGGRVEFGAGDSKSRMELEGFGIDPADRREMSRDAIEQVANMLALEPFPGYVGKHFSIPARNIVPKPTQKPHPPLWIAASDDATIHRAAQMGVGVLAHGFFDTTEAKRVVDDYYETFKRECVPIGHAVNPNVAMLNPFFCHEDETEALRIGLAAQGFLTYAVRHYYTFGRHRPGMTNIAERSATVRDEMGGDLPIRGSHAIGTPGQIAERMRAFGDVGVDQTIFLHQAGNMSHEDISRSMSLFAHEVLPEFKVAEQQRQHQKRVELAPYVQAAFDRKREAQPGIAVDIPTVDAYGLSRPAPDLSAIPADIREQMAGLERMRELAMRFDT